MKSFYEITYRHFRAPWDIGPREELVELVESGRLKPCRAIDLGSGTASNCIFLAEHGFDVTGVDYAEAARELGRKRAQEAGVSVNFIVDDLTNLRHVSGTFDLLVDYGTLDDLKPKDRDRYVQNVLPLTRPGALFLLYGFEYRKRWWERLVPFFEEPFAPGEVERRFGEYFEIERIAGKVDYSRWPPGYAVYLMTRKHGEIQCQPHAGLRPADGHSGGIIHRLHRTFAATLCRAHRGQIGCGDCAHDARRRLRVHADQERLAERRRQTLQRAARSDENIQNIQRAGAVGRTGDGH